MKWNVASRLLPLIPLLIYLASCSDEEPVITPTTLEITVVDEDVAPIQGANVSLYLSLDDWLQESNLVSSSNTDSEGLVSFAGLDTGEYFIDIQKETLNNWESGAKKEVFENIINSTQITIFESNSGLLSNAEGKKWVLKGYLRNEMDYFDFLDDCEKDSERTFFKGPALGAVLISPGEVICDSQEFNENGIWRFSPDQKNIDITIFNDSFRWTIELLTEDSLRYSYIQDITGFLIEEIYVSD